MKLFSFLSIIGFLLLVPTSGSALLSVETEELSPSVSQESSSSKDFMEETQEEEPQLTKSWWRCPNGSQLAIGCVEDTPDDPCCDSCLSWLERLIETAFCGASWAELE